MLSKRRGIVLLALMLGCWVTAAPAFAQDADLAGTSFGQEDQIDLNRASLEELRTLPIPVEVADAIYDYRTYQEYFSSIYDLLKVKGMTPELLEDVSPMLFVTPVFEVEREEMAEAERRAQERYYVVQRFLSEEGASEGLVDEYIDQLKEPKNVNRLSYYDLISYQNVSPVDAVAIINEKEMAGRIENQRQLRSASGLTYWGYRNLRDFVRYDDPRENEGPKVSGDYQFRIYNTPYLLDDLDVLNENIQTTLSASEAAALTPEQRANLRNVDLNTYAGRLNLNTSNPYMTNKLRVHYGRNWTGAVITHRNLAEKNWDETSKYFVSGDDFKPVETPLGKFQLHEAVLGNYAVSFGQGLVMDATDFFMPRRTGYGYNVRSVGLRGDLSRSDEYTLKGGAVEATLGRVRGTAFYSRDDKDAILNPDGSFNSYITVVPRVSNELLEGIRDDIASGVLEGSRDTSDFLPMRDVMDEQVIGGNLKFEFRPGTYVGVTGVEMKYENNAFDTPYADRWNPSVETLFLQPDRRLDLRDSEIGARYNSLDLGNYRRVWGAEGQTVFENVSFAAEYGKLETSTKDNAISRIFANGPEAFVANAYVQYENFNFLALYRDYDLGYDNPYNRAFSEDAKWEGTLMDGNPFRLRNPYWGLMAMGNPQAKAEQGWYFNTRYQFTRQFTLTGLEFDTWKRKADGADQKRLTVRAEYRPIFPLRFRIRHRISSRHEQRPDDIRNFSSWDSRIEMRVYLSDYDRLDFLYSTSNVKFATRPRLNAPAQGGNTADNTVGSRGIPARAVQAALSHNFNDYLSAKFSTEIYDGFLYNFEDNEFVVVDGVGYRNWFLLRSRLSPNLSWRFKWTTDHQLARTYVDIRNFGDLVAPTPDATNARGDQTSYRFQLDYSF